MIDVSMAVSTGHALRECRDTFRHSAIAFAMLVAVGTLSPAPVAAQSTNANWTGCYVGGHVGGLWGKADDWTVKTPGGAFEGQSLGGHDLSSWLGGVQGGCDLQRDRFVVGIRADYSWADADGSHPSTRETGVTYASSIKGSGAVTARAGYSVDRFLGYLKAGLAWQRDSYDASTTMIGTAYTADETRLGWTVGVGGEYLVTSAVSVFLEYDYRDFGTDTIDLTPEIEGLGPASVAITSRTRLLRAGVNWRF
ncbi:MAG: outer membrane beta-barrel protein [Pseudomonadota bacterium]